MSHCSIRRSRSVIGKEGLQVERPEMKCFLHVWMGRLSALKKGLCVGKC